MRFYCCLLESALDLSFHVIFLFTKSNSLLMMKCVYCFRREKVPLGNLSIKKGRFLLLDSTTAEIPSGTKLASIWYASVSGFIALSAVSK